MKKCISCGREIPDDAVFCGFCGTRQPETENTEPEEKKEVPVTETSETEENNPEPSEEKDAEVTESPDENPETSEETKEDSEEKDDNDPSGIKDAEIVEPAEESSESKEPEPSETENDASDVSDSSVSEDTEEHASEIKDAEVVTDASEEKKENPEETSEKKPHVQMKKIELPKINVKKEDFNILLDIVQNPAERQGINNTTTWIILIFAWIAGWVAFGSFGAGFISLLIVLIGMIFINWLTLKDHATFGETVRNSAEVIFTPSLLLFAGGLFIRNVKAGAEVFAFHSIFTTAFIGLFFLTAALILFLLTVIKRYEMKIWHMVLILTAFTALLIWYLMTSGAIALFS